MENPENTPVKQDVPAVTKSATKAKATKATKAKKIKVKITAAVAGKFLLPYNIDQVVTMEEKQAQTLIDANCAVAVKK